MGTFLLNKVLKTSKFSKRCINVSWSPNQIFFTEFFFGKFRPILDTDSKTHLHTLEHFFETILIICEHEKLVASASSSRFEAHIGLLRLLIKEIFDPYVL